jgi:hypothetical protein
VQVLVEPRSALVHLLNVPRGAVNSTHHQAVEALGKGLRAAARHADGTIEAIEWKDPTRKSWLAAVSGIPNVWEKSPSLPRCGVDFSKPSPRRATYPLRNAWPKGRTQAGENRVTPSLSKRAVAAVLRPRYWLHKASALFRRRKEGRALNGSAI